MKLLHLYYDLLNLYGDYANVSAVERMLLKNNRQVTVDRLSIGDDFDFVDYDFVFIGSGTERNQKTALKDLMRRRDSLNAYIASDGVMLMTGNSFEMLGYAIADKTGAVHEGLRIFDFSTREYGDRRFVGDVIYSCDFLDAPLVGFVNKSSEIIDVRDPLFRVEFGIGNTADDRCEGTRLNNLFCTHLTGPALMKNPHFLSYTVGLILGHAPVDDYLVYERAGYEKTLEKLKERAAASK